MLPVGWALSGPVRNTNATPRLLPIGPSGNGRCRTGIVASATGVRAAAVDTGLFARVSEADVVLDTSAIFSLICDEAGADEKTRGPSPD